MVCRKGRSVASCALTGQAKRPAGGPVRDTTASRWSSGPSLVVLGGGDCCRLPFSAVLGLGPHCLVLVWRFNIFV